MAKFSFAVILTGCLALALVAISRLDPHPAPRPETHAQPTLTLNAAVFAIVE